MWFERWKALNDIHIEIHVYSEILNTRKQLHWLHHKFWKLQYVVTLQYSESDNTTVCASLNLSISITGQVIPLWKRQLKCYNPNGHSSVFPAFLWSYGCGSCGPHSTEVNWKLKSTQSIKNKVQAQPCRRFKHQKHETILKIPINGDSPTPCLFCQKVQTTILHTSKTRIPCSLSYYDID